MVDISLVVFSKCFKIWRFLSSLGLFMMVYIKKDKWKNPLETFQTLIHEQKERTGTLNQLNSELNRQNCSIWWANWNGCRRKRWVSIDSLFIFRHSSVRSRHTWAFNYHLRTEPAQHMERLAFTSAGLSEISDSCTWIRPVTLLPVLAARFFLSRSGSSY